MRKNGAMSARRAVVKRRIFAREFKLQLLREIKGGKTQAQVAREYQITPNTICKGQPQFRHYKDQAFAGNGHVYTDQARIQELERMIRRLTVENDFLKNLLTKLEGQSY